jgi:hypothetical protein
LTSKLPSANAACTLILVVSACRLLFLSSRPRDRLARMERNEHNKKHPWIICGTLLHAEHCHLDVCVCVRVCLQIWS